MLIEAEGEEEDIKQFVAWCRKGPPRAEVSNIDVREMELNNFQQFEIKR